MVGRLFYHRYCKLEKQEHKGVYYQTWWGRSDKNMIDGFTNYFWRYIYRDTISNQVTEKGYWVLTTCEEYFCDTATPVYLYLKSSIWPWDKFVSADVKLDFLTTGAYIYIHVFISIYSKYTPFHCISPLKKLFL